MGGRAYGAVGALTNPNAPSVTIGEVAHQSISCNPILGTLRTTVADGFETEINFVGLIDITAPDGAEVLRSGEVENAGLPTADMEGSDAYERSTVHRMSALNGLIQANVVTARAHTRLDGTGFDHHTDLPGHDGTADGSTGAQFLDLFIAGERISATPPPNTEIPLDGIGKVVLNEQQLTGKKVADPGNPAVKVFSGVEVNAIHVYVTEPFFGYTGDFVVAHAETRILPAPGRVSGYAYSLNGSVSPFVEIGKQAIIGLPCAGTKGDVKERTQAGVTVPGISGSGVTELAKSSTMRNTVSADLTSLGGFSESTSTTEALSLFDGMITASLVKSVARSSSSGSGVSSSGEGSHFVDLKVGSETFTGTAPPNTRIPLDGIGSVTLNWQTCYDNPDRSIANKTCTGDHYNAVTVIAIRVLVELPDNPTGLPVGTSVHVAVAHSDLAF